MIDPRFPPRLSTVEVPLYPSREVYIDDIPEDSERKLTMELCDAFGCHPDELVIGTNASTLLRHYLGYGHSGHGLQRVGIPSFVCQSVVDAVIGSNSIPIFYDVEPDVSLGDKAVDYMIDEGCSSCVWPSFFGSNVRSSRIIDKLHDASISIIFDEAQSNPLSRDTQALVREGMEPEDAVLYSFGPSKLIAGLGGGALQMSRANDRLIGIRTAIDEEIASEPDMEAYEESAHIARISRLMPNFATSRGYSPYPARRMDELLESLVPDHGQEIKIGRYEAAFISRQLGSYQESAEHHASRYIGLRDVLIKEIGEDVLSFVERVEQTPSTLALKVNPAERYNFMSVLSQEGVQATWYYYPMHRISRYTGFPAQDDFNTYSISGSILILPFQWMHTDSEVESVARALAKIKKGV